MSALSIKDFPKLYQVVVFGLKSNEKWTNRKSFTFQLRSLIHEIVVCLYWSLLWLQKQCTQLNSTQRLGWWPKKWKPQRNKASQVDELKWMQPQRCSMFSWWIAYCDNVTWPRTTLQIMHVLLLLSSLGKGK